MTDVTVNISEEQISQMELRRLLKWACKNQKDWDRICHPDCFHPEKNYLADLLDKLYREKLYTVMFFVVFAHNITAEMDRSIAKTTLQCILDLPINEVLQRFCRNIKEYTPTNDQE